MTDPTSILASGLLTRYVLENPWPLVILLLIAAVVSAYIAVQRDNSKLLGIPLALGAVAGLVLLIASLATTPAEQAMAATREFVRAAEDGRSDDMISMLRENATLHIGRTENAGQPLEELERELRMLDGVHRIVSNRITRLEAQATEPDTVVVELGCYTETESSFGTVPSAWLVEWRKEPNGTWMVRRITAAKIAGRVPTGSVLR